MRVDSSSEEGVGAFKGEHCLRNVGFDVEESASGEEFVDDLFFFLSGLLAVFLRERIIRTSAFCTAGLLDH